MFGAELQEFSDIRMLPPWLEDRGERGEERMGQPVYAVSLQCCCWLQGWFLETARLSKFCTACLNTL
jgi:hypothetical protein